MQAVSGNVAHTSPVVVEDGMVPVCGVAGACQPKVEKRFPIADMDLSNDESEEG